MSILNNKRGMTLVEVLIASGIMSLLAVTAATVTKDMFSAQKSNSQSYDATAMQNTIASLLSDGNVCTRNFGNTGTPITLSSTNQTTDLLAPNGGGGWVTAFDVNSSTGYMNNALTFKSWQYNVFQIVNPGPPAVVIGQLTLNLEKTGQSPVGGKAVGRSIMMMTTLSGAVGTPVATCYAIGGVSGELWAENGTDIYNTNAGRVSVGSNAPIANANLSAFMNGQTNSIATDGPVSIGGNVTSTGTIQAPANGSVLGSTSTGSLSVTGTIASSANVTSTGFCIGGNCRTTFAAQSCPAGQLPTTFNVDGTVSCSTSPTAIGSSLNCPGGTYFAGISGAAPVCNALPTGSCPVGQYVETFNTSTGVVTCKTIPPNVAVTACPGGQYMTEVVAGIPTCSTPSGVGNITCGAGQSLTSISGGVATCTDLPAKNFSCPGGQQVTGFDASGAPVCTASAGDTATLTATGQTVLPSGLVIKWGSFTVTNDNAGGTHTFPVPFPNQTFSVVVTMPSGNGNAQDNGVSVSSFNRTSFNWINARDAVPVTAWYIAIGY